MGGRSRLPILKLAPCPLVASAEGAVGGVYHSGLQRLGLHPSLFRRLFPRPRYLGFGCAQGGAAASTMVLLPGPSTSRLGDIMAAAGAQVDRWLGVGCDASQFAPGWDELGCGVQCRASMTRRSRHVMFSGAMILLDEATGGSVELIA